MAERDWDSQNRRVVTEFRASGGRVGGYFSDKPLLLLTTTGAKTGRVRTNPLGYLADGDRYVALYPQWAEYQARTTRQIPVIALVRNGDVRSSPSPGSLIGPTGGPARLDTKLPVPAEPPPVECDRDLSCFG